MFTEFHVQNFYYMLHIELWYFSCLQWQVACLCTNATSQNLVLIKYTHPCIPQMQLQKPIECVGISKTAVRTRETRCQ
jgi:hypothetical protein